MTVERKPMSKLDTIDDFSDESFLAPSAKAKTSLSANKTAPIPAKPAQPAKLKQAPTPYTKPVMSVPPQAQAKKAEQPATNVSSNTATAKTFAAVASGKKPATKPSAQSSKQPAAVKPPHTQTSKWSTAKPASSGLNSLDVVDDVLPVSSNSYGLETAAANTELSFDLPSLLTPVGSFPSLAPISKPITKPASLPNMENKNVDLSLNNLDEISTLAALDPNFDDQQLDVPVDQNLLLTSNSLFDLASKNELVDHVSASMGFTSDGLNSHTPSFSLLDEKAADFGQFNLSVKPFLVNDSLFGLGGIIPSGLISDEAKSSLVFEASVSPIKKPIGAERQASNSTSKSASNSNLTTPQSPSLQKQYMDVGFGSGTAGTGHKIPTPPLTSLQMMSDAQTNPIRPSSTSSLQSSSQLAAKSVSNPIQAAKSVIAKPSQASNRSTPSPHQNQSEPVQQKQTIRVQPQQKLNPQPKPPTPQPPQQQQQQQQQSQQQQTQTFLQQQLLINNLQSLLINGNNEIDQQQVTSLIMQLISQLNQNNPNNLSLNSLNAWNQPAQNQPAKTINSNTTLQMPFAPPGASLNKQQQQQQAFNPNQASFVNSNAKMFNAAPAAAATSSSFNPLMWQNDLGLNNNHNNNTNNFKSAATPSPPPTTASSANSTSSSSSMNAQSNSSSSTPSPHLINPPAGVNQQMFANSSLFPAQYNYFGNANAKANAFPSFNPLTSMPIVKPSMSYANQAQQLQQQSQFRVNTGLSQHPSASNSPFNGLNSSSGLQANQTPMMFSANPQSVSFGLTSSLLAQQQQQQQQQQAVSSSLLTNNQISSLLPNPIMRANNFQSNSTNMNNFNRHNFE